MNDQKWKRWRLIIIGAIMVSILSGMLAGCAAMIDPGPYQAGSTESATLSAEASTEEAEVANEDEMETALTDALTGMLGNLGSAGGTMKLMKRTVNLMMLASHGGYTKEVVTPVAEQFVKGLNDDERMDFLDEWESAKVDADQILNDYDSVKELLGDAGCEKEAETLTKDPSIADEWKEMQEAIDEVMAAESLVKVE